MTIPIIKGNLLDALDQGSVDAIGHCVNCQQVMGSGIAKEIRSRYPEVYNSYMNIPKGSLGHTQEVLLSGYGDKRVYNLFAQMYYGRGKVQVDYDAIEKCLESMRDELRGNMVVGFPYLMCSDRAGGDWSVIVGMIFKIFRDHKVRLYKL